MFGLSFKEIYTKVIINACVNNKNIYKDGIRELMKKEKSGQVSDKEIEKMMLDTRRKYLDAVLKSVQNALEVGSPKIISRFNLFLSSEITKHEEGMMAGSIYNICSKAIKNREADSRTCVFLNHAQNDIMEKVLYELSTENNV